jgi:hypothetical protein
MGKMGKTSISSPDLHSLWWLGLRYLTPPACVTDTWRTFFFKELHVSPQKFALLTCIPYFGR